MPEESVQGATRHRRLSERLLAELPADHALHLFTPVGERVWVEHWSPHFPNGERGDGADPGTVFVTDGEHGETVWVVTDRGERHIRYARVTAGTTAGTVEVTCRAMKEGNTSAEVTYDLTALTDHGTRVLAAFADHYLSFIREWERLIDQAVTDGRVP